MRPHCFKVPTCIVDLEQIEGCVHVCMMIGALDVEDRSL